MNTTNPISLSDFVIQQSRGVKIHMVKHGEEVVGKITEREHTQGTAFFLSVPQSSCSTRFANLRGMSVTSVAAGTQQFIDAYAQA